MNTDYKPSFLRSLKKITDPILKETIKQVINSVKIAQVPKNIPNLRKMRGNKKGIYYRISVGDYRIGVAIEGDLVTFAVCLPRKDIYKFFP